MVRRFLTLSSCLGVLAGGAIAQGPEVTLTASLAAGADGVAQMTVGIEIGDGWSASAAGIPQPLLQLDPGDGARLEGKALIGIRAQSRNEYLFAPYERMADPGSTEVALRVLDGDKSIGVNLVAYVRKEGKGRAYFIRRRVDLPLIAGSTVSSSVPATRSDWGPGDFSGLTIGETAPGFELPHADGSTIQLSDYLGKKDIIVTTYRAHW